MPWNPSLYVASLYIELLAALPRADRLVPTSGRDRCVEKKGGGTAKASLQIGLLEWPTDNLPRIGGYRYPRPFPGKISDIML